MKFANTTPMEGKALTAFARACVKGAGNRVLTLVRIFHFVLGAFALFVSFAGTAFGGFDWSLAPLLLIGIVCVATGIFFYPYNAWLSKRQLTKGITKNEFRFTEGEFVVIDEKATTQHIYDAISVICADAGYYFLFLDKKHGYILDKACFSMGSPRDFEQFISEKCNIEWKNIC